EDDRWHPELLQRVYPLIAELEVEQEHSVHPPLGPPRAVQVDLPRLILRRREQQRDVIPGQLSLDAGDQLHEEGLDAERSRRAVDDQPECARPTVGQCSRSAAGLEADLARDREDALSRGCGDAGLAVEGA